MFRNSVFDYVRRICLIDPDEFDDVEAAWERQGPAAIHLENTVVEEWMDGGAAVSTKASAVFGRSGLSLFYLGIRSRDFGRSRRKAAALDSTAG